MSTARWILWAAAVVTSSACSGQSPEPQSSNGGASGATHGGGGQASPGRGGAGGGSGASGAAGTGAAGSAAGTAGSAGTAGNIAAGGSAGVGGEAGAPGALHPEPDVVKDGEVRLSDKALSVVSYGGYLNGESFQQEGVLTFEGYQYTAFWNTARHVVLARRALPNGEWQSLEFTDYANTESDAHNTISIGVAPGDGTLHLAFDHHGSKLHYRRSVPGLASAPSSTPWATSSFSATTDTLVSGSPVSDLTYPRFITAPGGNKLLFSARIGTSGAGDEHLWEYDATNRTWKALGKYIDGASDDINAYLHGIAYTPGGTRLHAAWCWRETPNASTNRDLAYIYSDDDGRTWKNNEGTVVGTTGTTPITQSAPGLHVERIAKNRGLINQEHLVVDEAGRVHVLLSHLPDDAADDSDFDSARSKSQYFHYMRDLDGTWTKTALGLPVVANLRGKLALSSSQNLYAILPDLRIAGASFAENYATWSLFDDSDVGRFFSDPLIDSARLLLEDKLTVVYQERASTNLYVLDYTLR